MFRAVFVCLLAAAVSLGAAEGAAPGLAVSIRAAQGADMMVLERAELYVPAGGTASPFVAPGAFAATWEGFINADLRTDYAFVVEGAGEVILTINDASALAGRSSPGQKVQGSTVRLNKGPNKFKLEYRSPAQGPASVRLFWTNAETPLNPVPPRAFTHASSPELTRALELHAGRDLFAELHCAQCHTTSRDGMVELQRDAPQLSGIGSVRSTEWLAQWILNPRALQPTAHMPALFSGPEAQSAADTVAAYLATLRDESPKPALPEGSAEAGQTLFQNLQCASCHEGGPARPAVSLDRIAVKFTQEDLARYLLKPEARHLWTRMPNFHLEDQEAADLAAWLVSKSQKPPGRTIPSTPELAEQGRRLVATTGCINCHAIAGATSELAAKPVVALTPDRWTAGCLAETVAAGSRAPRFGLTAAQRSALRAFGATDRTALTRHTPVDFAIRQTAHLNCASCHGKTEGIPTVDLIGAKLKPEWSAQFIAGAIAERPRPWLESRMPAFPAYAEHLAPGLAALHGLPPKTPDEPPPNAELAAIGQRLVSSKGGFFCVSCHDAGEFVASARVTEVPGINFAQTYSRMQPDFFHRWVRSPSSIDPKSKMPTFFSGGTSPLKEVFDGDLAKTIQAIWEYVRQGEAMPAPE